MTFNPDDMPSFFFQYNIIGRMSPTLGFLLPFVVSSCRMVSSKVDGVFVIKKIPSVDALLVVKCY